MTSGVGPVPGGGLGVVLIFGAATLVIGAYGVLTPGQGSVPAAFFFLGLVATWRQYRAWRGRAGAA